MSTRTYQAVAEALALPPLSPAFKDGWQSSDVKPPKPSRSIVRDDDGMRSLSTPPLAPRFPQGGESLLGFVPRLSKSVTKDEQSMRPLSVPPLTPPFGEGWDAQPDWIPRLARSIVADNDAMRPITLVPRSIPFIEGWDVHKSFVPALSRSLSRDNDAMRPLGSIPLAPAFREGWQAIDARQGKPVQSARRVDDFPITTQANASPPTYGWDGINIAVARLSRSIVRDNDAMRPLSKVPLAPAFKDGWQPIDVRPGKPVQSAARIDVFLTIPRPVASTVNYGWQTSDNRAIPIARTVLRQDPLPPFLQAYIDGWQAIDVRQPKPTMLIRHVDELSRPVSAYVVDGWQTAEVRTAKQTVTSRRVEDHPWVTSRIVEGWQAIDVKPRNPVPAVRRASDLPQLTFAVTTGWLRVDYRRPSLRPFVPASTESSAFVSPVSPVFGWNVTDATPARTPRGIRRLEEFPWGFVLIVPPPPGPPTRTPLVGSLTGATRNEIVVFYATTLVQPFTLQPVPNAAINTQTVTLGSDFTVVDDQPMTDSQLSVNVVVGQSYEFTANLIFTTPVRGGYLFECSHGPATLIPYTATVTSNQGGATLLSPTVNSQGSMFLVTGSGGDGNINTLTIKGSFKASTGGQISVSLQASPDTQSVILKAGSTLSVLQTSNQVGLPPDITGDTWAFTVRDKFRGTKLLQKTSGAGIVTTSGPNALWQLSLTKADLTTWLDGVNVQPGYYEWDMELTNPGKETQTHFGDFIVLPSYLSN